MKRLPYALELLPSAHPFVSNCFVVFTGLTKGEKIVASDPFPQTIKNFEVHNGIRFRCE
jgi:hypothetical protein